MPEDKQPEITSNDVRIVMSYNAVSEDSNTPLVKAVRNTDVNVWNYIRILETFDEEENLHPIYSEPDQITSLSELNDLTTLQILEAYEVGLFVDSFIGNQTILSPLSWGCYYQWILGSSNQNIDRITVFSIMLSHISSLVDIVEKYKSKYGLHILASTWHLNSKELNIVTKMSQELYQIPEVFSKIIENIHSCKIWKTFSRIIYDVTALLSSVELNTKPLWADSYPSEERELTRLLQNKKIHALWTTQVNTEEFDTPVITILNGQTVLNLSSEMIINTIGEALTLLLFTRGANSSQIYDDDNNEFVMKTSTHVADFFTKSLKKKSNSSISLIEFYRIIEDILIEHNAHDVAKVLVYKRTLLFQFLPQDDQHDLITIRTIIKGSKVIKISLAIIINTIEAHLLNEDLTPLISSSIANSIANRLSTQHYDSLIFPRSIQRKIETIQNLIKEEIMRRKLFKCAQNYILNQEEKLKQLTILLEHNTVEMKLTEPSSPAQDNEYNRINRLNLGSRRTHFRDILPSDKLS